MAVTCWNEHHEGNPWQYRQLISSVMPAMFDSILGLFDPRDIRIRSRVAFGERSGGGGASHTTPSLGLTRKLDGSGLGDAEAELENEKRDGDGDRCGVWM